MNRSDWDRISSLFSAASKVRPEELDDFLARECEGHAELRIEVEALLAAEAAIKDFVEPGKQLPGGWQILEKIGEGPLGASFKARRSVEGIAQTAVVKMLPTTLERLRLLPALSHPNLARLFDSGSIHGMPYVVVELVEDGQAAPAYCEANRLSIQERLNLFLKVCDAVEYAHQQLVVHRDIKPENVLITADGQPKVLNTGMAKLLENDGTDALARTLNMAYASPEQLRGQSSTTSMDIFSLGALLSEMLCGQGRDLTLLKTPQEVAAYLESGPPLQPGSIRKYVPADIDAIVAKATRPDPQTRYLSVEHLAADIRRHQEGQPVLARPATWAYRTRRFVGRNRLMLTAGTILATGFVLFAWGFVRSEIQRYRAEQQLSETRAITGMMAMYIPGRITEFPGSLQLRRKMIGYGIAYLDKQSAERDPADLKQRRMLAIGYFDVANSLGGPNVSNVGLFAEAARCYKIAADMLLEDGVPLRKDPQVLGTIGQALVRRPETLLRLRQPQAAVQAAESCIQLAARIRDNTEGRTEQACRAIRLRALADLGKPIADAEVESILQREAELEGSKVNPVALASSTSLAAQLYLHNRSYQKALDHAVSGLDITAKAERNAALSLQRARLLLFAANAETSLGLTERVANRFDEALDVLRELLRKMPENVEVRVELARALVDSLPFVEEDSIRKGRLNEAEALVRGVLNDTTYPAAHFQLVRVLAAQADLRSDCALRARALEEFGKLAASGASLPGDQTVVTAIRAKACQTAGTAQQP